MTQKELSLTQGKDIDNWYDFITDKLSESFESFFDPDEEKWFKIGNRAFHVLAFEKPLYGFIIEYAKNVSDANKGIAEDGDQWPLLSYKTPEEMYQKMLLEINM